MSADGHPPTTWRIFFRWTDAGVGDVQIVDCHWGGQMAEKLYPPARPGEVLIKDFIDGFGIAQNKFAVAIGVPP